MRSACEVIPDTIEFFAVLDRVLQNANLICEIDFEDVLLFV